MSYEIHFSDLRKANTITVPAMPPGINTVDTSLSLVGPGYPSYGIRFAENFVHLLENFSSATSPANPVEGQLWYDTSDPSNKVLRIMNGSATSARWPVANGIYQQELDPASIMSVRETLKKGDIWVNTADTRLSIYTVNGWVNVGPNSTFDTGPLVVQLTDTTGIGHWVIRNVVNNVTVSIISSNTFVPNPVIYGFSKIVPGINLSSSMPDNQPSVINGTAMSANALLVNGVIVPTASFLRKDDISTDGQVISGSLTFTQPAIPTNILHSGVAGKDGVVINIMSRPTTDYIQFYKSDADAVLVNNTVGGVIQFKTNSGIGPSVVLSAYSKSVCINTNTNAAVDQSISLDVFGSVRISDQLILTSQSDAALEVNGGITAAGSVAVTAGLLIKGTANLNGIVTVGSTDPSGQGISIAPTNNDQYDLGSPTKQFRTLFVSEIVGASSNFPGMIVVYAGITPPRGWLVCNGAILNTTTNQQLFAAIGYKYGGSGGYFSLPTFTNRPDDAGHTVGYIIKT